MSSAARTEDHDAPVDVDRGLWMYGVVPGGLASPDEVGVDGEPIEVVRAGDVAAVVSWMNLDRPPGRKAELLAYHGVLDVLARSGPVAPVRFGTVMADREAVVEFLEVQEGELGEVLALLEGRRQFNLRAKYVEDAVLAELVTLDPEIRDLHERTREMPEDASYPDRVRLGELVVRGLEQRGAEDAALLLDTVLPRVVEHVDRTASNPSVVLDVALLVDESQGDELVQVLEGLAEAVHERIRLELVGPMAPYDFAGAF